MADRTLTINHADGDSETYTINRDKFAGVREMSRGHVYPSSQFYASGTSAYWSATATAGTEGTEWNLVSDLGNDSANNFGDLMLASLYTASKVRVGKHRVEFNLTLNSGVINNGSSNLADRPLVLVTRDRDDDPTTLSHSKTHEVVEGFNSIDVEVFDDGVEIAGLNFLPSIFLSARPSSVFDVTISNLKVTHEPDTVTVDRTAVPKEQSKETTFGGSQSITIKREIEPLLSEVVGGASAAYSLRDLNDKAGNSKVVRVRRASDNAEKDFKAKEVSNGTLVDWVGAGNDGFVEAWYDQSGNGNDATQQVAGSQPKIVDAGVLVTDRDGKVALNGKGAKLKLPANAPMLSSDGTYSLFDVVDFDNQRNGNDEFNNIFRFEAKTFGGASSQRKPMLYLYNTIGGLSASGPSYNAGSTNLTLAEALSVQLLTNIANPALSTGNNTLYADGVLVDSRLNATGVNTETLTSINTYIFEEQETTVTHFLSEVIYYPSDQSANRAAIEANINNQYDIY